MMTRILPLLALLVLALSAPAHAQPDQIARVPRSPVADRPTCNADREGWIWTITDASSSSSCSGGGSASSACQCQGGTWGKPSGGGPVGFDAIQAGASTAELEVGDGGDLDWTGTGNINARRTGNTRYSRDHADWKACLEAGDGARECVLTPGRYDVGAGLAITPVTSASGANGSLVVARCDGATLYSTSAAVSGGVVSFNLSSLQHDTEVIVSGCRIDGSAADDDETGLLFTSATGSGGLSGRVRIEGVSIGESGLGDGSETGLWYERTGLSFSLVMANSRVQAAGKVFRWEHGARVMITNTLLNGSAPGVSPAADYCLDVGEDNAVSDTYAGFVAMAAVRFSNCGGIRTKTGAVLGDFSFAGTIGDPTEDAPIWTVSDGNLVDVRIAYQANATEGSGGPLVYMESDDLAARVAMTEGGCQYLSLGPEIFEGAAGVVPRSLSAEIGSGAVACSGGVPFGDTLLAEDRTGSRGLVRLHGGWHEYVGNTAPLSRPAAFRPVERLRFGSSTGTSPNTSGCLATALTAYQTSCAGPGATNQATPIPAGTVVYAFSCARGGTTTGWDGGESVDVQLASWNGSAWANVTGALVQLTEADATGDVKAAAAFAPVTISSDTTLAALTPAFTGSGMTMDLSCTADVVLPLFASADPAPPACLLDDCPLDEATLL